VYRALTLHHLRGVSDLRAEGLKRFNLIVGRNNAGKTTLLEAAFLLGGATNPVFPTTLGQLRGQRLGGAYPDQVWRPLFYGLDPRQTISVTGSWDNEPAARRLNIEALEVNAYSDWLESSAGGAGGGVAAITDEFQIGGLRLRYSDGDNHTFTSSAVFDPKTGNIDAQSKDRADFVRTTFVSARAYSNLVRDAQQFSFLVKNKHEQEVVDGLKVIESGLQRIEVLSEPGGPSVYADFGLPGLIPLSVAGEGFVRLFSILVEVTASRRGVLLIDEIDNGLHHSVMDELWRILRTMCERHDVQVLATTHNDEIIHSAFVAFQSDLSNFGLFRVDRRDGIHRCVAYDQESLEAVREQHFETRG
jgi:hypothetical protein